MKVELAIVIALKKTLVKDNIILIGFPFVWLKKYILYSSKQLVIVCFLILFENKSCKKFVQITRIILTFTRTQLE